MFRAGIGYWVPTATAAVTIAPACAASSRSIGTTSRSRRSARSPTKSRSPLPGSMPRSQSTTSIRKSRIPQRCNAMGALVDIKVPDIGDFTDVEVIEVMVKPGDPVRVDDSLITIESDKASMEVPATEAGIVKEIRVKVGDKVSEGSPIVVIETAPAADGKAAAAPASAPAAKPAQAPALTVVKKTAPAPAQLAKQAKPPSAAEEA